MADLHAAVTGYLTKRGWPLDDRGHLVVTPVLGRSGRWSAFFEIRDPDQQLIVHSVVPVTVPPERRTAAALYLTRANFGLAIGSFDLDLDGGEVRFRTSVDVEGAELSEPLIDHLFLANIVGVDQYFAGLRSVIRGADPVVAIGAAELASARAPQRRDPGRVPPAG